MPVGAEAHWWNESYYYRPVACLNSLMMNTPYELVPCPMRFSLYSTILTLLSSTAATIRIFLYYYCSSIEPPQQGADDSQAPPW
jgi:hypothetical protein